VEALQVVQSVGGGEPSTALVLAMHYLFLRVAEMRWPRDIADRLHRESIEKIALINALRVEPEQGSPARGGLPATIARKAKDGWLLNGHKIFSTGVPILSWYVVWARTEDAEPHLGNFLVQAGSPGIEVRETWDHAGLRASNSHDVIFNDVLIPDEWAVELKAPKDWKPDPQQVAWSTVLVSAIYNGIAHAARNWTYGFLKSRKPSNLGQALTEVPRIQLSAGRIESLLAVNDRLLASAARDADAGHPPTPSESGIIKTTVTENAISAVDEMLRISGNHGLTRHNPLERHFRDVLCGRIHTPQEDSVKIEAARLAFAG